MRFRTPAIEFKSEGYVAGLGAKMFIIAGPVIVYGVTASVVFGAVLWVHEYLGITFNNLHRKRGVSVCDTSFCSLNY